MKQIPFAKNYFITESGEVYRDNIKLSTFNIKDIPHTSIMYDTGVKRTNSIGYLLLSTYKPLDSNLISTQYRVKYIDGNKNNISLDNLTWISRSDEIRSRVDVNIESINKQFIRPTDFELKDGYCVTKIDCEYLPGYYWLPHFDLPIVINEYGNLKYLHTGEDIPWQDTGYGYKQVGIKLNGKYKYYYVHRLVCALFNPISDLVITNKQVNHKDGNKSNNYYTNLEWVTPKENCIHAINTGLVKLRKVLSKNILTGEIKTWVSCTECARYFNISEKRLKTVLCKPETFGKKSVKWNIFKYEDEPHWVELNEDDYIENSLLSTYVWIAKDQTTNVSIIFNTLRELCLELNENYTTVRDHFYNYKERNNIPYKQWLISHSVIETNKTNYKELTINKPKPVLVKFNNKQLEFDSITKACKHLNILSSKVSENLKQYNIHIDNKFVISYLSDDK